MEELPLSMRIRRRFYESESEVIYHVAGRLDESDEKITLIVIIKKSNQSFPTMSAKVVCMLRQTREHSP